MRPLLSPPLPVARPLTPPLRTDRRPAPPPPRRQPIPLEFLAIVGSEHDPVEHRRDMVVDYARRNPLRASMGGLLEPLVQPGRDIFAFHLEHRGLGKQYSLYVESEQGRREWLACIRDQVTIRRVHNAVRPRSPARMSLSAPSLKPRRC